ncbi:MAG: hypothetical protein UY95_C0020G0005 [Parcubacteria group bacterium GW2011_GWA2_56_7]|nr:MAG: hypothetical protein UY95_C0020G0005 [Parcubacteria group bacterium GW2011_GWA2_56_7]
MILTVHVKPGAKTARIERVLDETTMSVSVCAPAREGKANRALIDLLSETLHLPKTSIEIIRGATTRIKHVRVPDTTVLPVK